MKLYSLNSYRPGNQKGVTVVRGDEFEVDEHTGQQLIARGLATKDKKMLKEHENKMQQEFSDKGLPVESETPEERSQGVNGPVKKVSETPEIRSQGHGKPGTPQPPQNELPGTEIRWPDAPITKPQSILKQPKPLS